jgi:hypothetical protein
MGYLGGILSGVASSGIFWLLDKYVLVLDKQWQWLGMVGCFILFGVAGFLFASASRASASNRNNPASVGSGVSGKNVSVTLADVKVGQGAAIASNLDAKGDVIVDVRRVES